MKTLKNQILENCPFIIGGIVIIVIGVIWLIELFGSNPAIY
jgi:putative Mn2+ efflux pump MntP